MSTRTKDRKYPSSIPGERDPDNRSTERDARRSDAANENAKLDEALKASFPASDPPEATQPGVTGWDLTEEERKKLKRK